MVRLGTRTNKKKEELIHETLVGAAGLNRHKEFSILAYRTSSLPHFGAVSAS